MYVPKNPSMFLAAYSGALAGMGASDRQPTNPSSVSLANIDIAAVAGAFAIQFDTVWGTRTTNGYDIDQVETLATSVWESRGPSSFVGASLLIPATYDILVKACIALITAGDTYLSGQGIAPLVQGGANWQTAFITDFSAQPGQVLAPNGPYIIDGKTYTKENTANEAAPMAVVHGSGLHITPDHVSNYDGATRTSPLLFLPFAQLGIASLDWATRLRIWIECSDNAAAAFDAVMVGVDSNSMAWSNVTQRGFISPGPAFGVSMAVIVNGAATFINNHAVAGAPPANDVILHEVMDNREPFAYSYLGAGPGLPAYTALNPEVSSQGLGAIGQNLFRIGAGPSPGAMGIVLTAISTGSATAYVANIKKLRVDFSPG
jgi:hypothetical protein